MNNTNRIFEAMNDLDENYAAEAILPRKKKMKKPLKIAIIVVAATLLLGTSAVAASSGDHPIMKLNHRQMLADYDEYVNENGWTVKTLTAVEPQDDIPTYRPVGKIRAVYNENDTGIFTFYDELGVDLEITQDTDIFGTAFKDDKSDMHEKGANGPDYLRGRASIAADYSWVSYEDWVDPIEYIKYKADEVAWNRKSLQEKADMLNSLEYGRYSTLKDFGGIPHPTAEEHYTVDGCPSTYIHNFDIAPSDRPDYSSNDILFKHYITYNYRCIPSTALKMFGFTPLIGENMTESVGRCFVKLDIDNDLKEFTQGMYQYSLNDTASGTPIEFTVWHKAELRESFTDHFDFEYEYIELNNGTQARLHRSVSGDYIAEFEYDGAFYAFKTSVDRDGVTRILIDLGVLN